MANSPEDQTNEKLVREINRRGLVGSDDAEEIADSVGVSKRRVIAKAAAMGVYFTSEEMKRKLMQTAKASPTDNQYGVLQGAANVTGGCATMWGWLIVFFMVAGLLALLTGQLS